MSVPTAEVISYQAAEVADDYRRWDDAGSWAFGYSFVPAALGGLSQGARVLDLGCGPGEVTRFVAERCPGVRFTAVDSSPAMIDLAHRHFPHPRVEYGLSEPDGVPTVADRSMDAALAMFLFTCIGSQAQMQDLVDELARTLRPGGRLVILHPNPDQAHDVSFEGFHRGEPGARYTSGDPMPVKVRRRDGSWTTIVNSYWPRETFHAVLSAAGFTDIRETTPVFADAVGVASPDLLASRAWEQERSRAPFILFTATAHGRPGTTRLPRQPTTR
ncbi:class I SAM-dependent methyltransferase [Streptacidiphilus monticola]|uniref:Class I SAM-dependent methyltransferase n=1 Tax=Streptacidiphilus monticola TaxID=2161674 RepID=A0ABW1G5I2_9ACTN